MDPSSISDIRKENWVDEISKIFHHQLNRDVDETPCVSIFRVPKTITTPKPEAYEPRRIGLGPYHHFRPQLYNKTEQKKLAAMRRLLQDHSTKDFELLVLDKVRKLVPVVRECYDMFLPDDDDFLAWVFAIDGLFLLDMFNSYKKGDQLPPTQKTIAFQYASVSIPRICSQTENIVMSGNQYKQIKSDAVGLRIVIESEEISNADDIVVDQNNLRTVHGEIEESSALVDGEIVETSMPVSEDLNDVHPLVAGETEYSSPSKRSEVDPERRLMAQDIMMLENQIPFVVLKEINEALRPSSGHSFHSHSNFSPSVFRSFSEIHSPLALCSPSQAPAHVEHLLHYLYHSIANNIPVHHAERVRVRYGDYVEVPASTSVLISDVAGLFGTSSNFINKIPEIVQMYEQTITQSKTVIPSASKLHKRAGFRLHRLPKDQGIKKIDMKDKKIYLPRLTLNNDSEVILRNLVAYETMSMVRHSNHFPLTEYVVLMCGLIVNANDVKLLQEENIINGGLQVNEVVKLFSAMKSSIPRITMKEKSKLQVTIEEVNRVYESRLSTKVFLRAVDSFVYVSVKIVALMVCIVWVFTLVCQAYCDAFGCDKTKNALLTFASR